jgi:hypothetical protein
MLSPLVLESLQRFVKKNEAISYNSLIYLCKQKEWCESELTFRILCSGSPFQQEFITGWKTNVKQTIVTGSLDPGYV